MLVLSRNVGESILIGKDIVIKIIKVEGKKQVEIGITAPKSVSILREELIK